MLGTIDSATAAAIGKAVSDGMAKGLNDTSASRPSEWLMMFLCLGLVLLFLWYLRSRESKDDERQQKHADALAAVVTSCHEANAKSRGECHAYALELTGRNDQRLASLDQATAQLHGAADKLQGTATDLKTAVRDLRTLCDDGGRDA